MLLISFLESASGDSVEDALASLQRFISQCSSFIVQATLGMTKWYLCHFFRHIFTKLSIFPQSQIIKCDVLHVPGCCLNHMDSGYSHAAVIRFPSCK
mgnify:CR=1 FL=1|jgi:predicted metallopeptidase